ncbi:MAG: alpha/beta hydrolase [Planctomycetes bacterium]|nr:alpha/beta hydrolase [Planctomycetota bacterium]
MKKILLKRRQMEIAYEDEGTGDALLLLHAFPFDREMWRPQLGELSNSFRVIAPDFPGFGESSAATEGFHMEALAEMMADFLDEIGITGAVNIAGLSMGGYVAMTFARSHSNRLKRLILADTKASPDDAKAKAKRDEMSVIAHAEGSAGVIDRLLPRLLCEETISKKPTIVEQVRSNALRQTPTAIVNALLALRDRPDATAGLEQIGVPTLILVGEYDEITPPKDAFHLKDLIPGSTLVTILGAGHLSNIESPELFNAEVRRFLARPAPQVISSVGSVPMSVAQNFLAEHPSS